MNVLISWSLLFAVLIGALLGVVLGEFLDYLDSLKRPEAKK